MELKICHLYPDMMNLSGDRGNVICLQKRLSWRGIDVQTTAVTVGQPLRAADFDLIFLGDGPAFDRPVILQDLVGEKASQLRGAAEDGISVLAVCGGYQLLGRTYETLDGRILEGAGVLDVTTRVEEKRLVGDYAIETRRFGTLIGFENHAGKTVLGSGVQPLGTTAQGHGNNGTDGTEGAVYKNVIGTYAHGCLLGKNTVLCDHILLTALTRKYGTAELAPLDDTYEKAAHRYMLERLTK